MAEHIQWIKGLLPDTLYQCQARAVDKGGKKGVWSDVVEFRTEKDEVAPDVVTGISATQLVWRVLVTWTPSTADDIAGYAIYKDETNSFSAAKGNGAIGWSGKFPWFFDEVEKADFGTTFYYFVTPIDTSGNENKTSVPTGNSAVARKFDMRDDDTEDTLDYARIDADSVDANMIKKIVQACIIQGSTGDRVIPRIVSGIISTEAEEAFLQTKKFGEDGDPADTLTMAANESFLLPGATSFFEMGISWIYEDSEDTFFIPKTGSSETRDLWLGSSTLKWVNIGIYAEKVVGIYTDDDQIELIPGGDLVLTPSGDLILANANTAAIKMYIGGALRTITRDAGTGHLIAT